MRMDRAAFEADLRRDGYDEVVVGQFPPGHKPGEHTHPYDVRALILEGEFTIAVAGDARAYRPGEVSSSTPSADTANGPDPPE
jgi:quercetin dioxygenase-like cupin family protein